MKHLKHIFVCGIAAVSLLSCKSQFDLLLESGDADTKYAGAFELFNKGKYQKAAQLFESLAVMTTGTERDDTVQYYWGLSNYNNKDFVNAETNFTNFVEHFPRSPFTEKARFLILDCLYRSTLRYELDQSPTYKAITAINEYLISYPDNENRQVCDKMLAELGERLQKKAFENARIYYTMEDYKAARVALRNVLKDNADNMYREQILYYTAMSSYKYAFNSVQKKQKERYIQFVDDYLNFIGEYPESKYRRELDALYRKVKEKN